MSPATSSMLNFLPFVWKKILVLFSLWAVTVGIHFLLNGFGTKDRIWSHGWTRILPVLVLLFAAVSKDVKADGSRVKKCVIAGLVFSLIADVVGLWFWYGPEEGKKNEVGLVELRCISRIPALLSYLAGISPKENSPLRYVAVCVCAFTAASTCYLYYCITTPRNIVIVVLSLIYLALIVTQVWRSSVFFYQELSFSSASGCIGGYTFALSTMFSLFHSHDVPIAFVDACATATYFIAQLGMAANLFLHRIEYTSSDKRKKRR